jgi:hypothetical protein
MLPLAERSGVNVAGKFNVDNTTVFEDVPGEEGEGGGVRGDVEMGTGSGGNDSAPVDTGLYHTFWAMQGYFVSPLSILESVQEWRGFSTSVNTIMEALSSHTLESSAPAAAAARGRAQSRRGGADERKGCAAGGHGGEQTGAGAGAGGGAGGGEGAALDFFSVKYLTSSKLFHLQLRDPKLQQHVLLQFLIVLTFLASRVEQHARSVAAIEASTSNKASPAKRKMTMILPGVEVQVRRRECSRGGESLVVCCFPSQLVFGGHWWFVLFPCTQPCRSPEINVTVNPSALQ